MTHQALSLGNVVETVSSHLKLVASSSIHAMHSSQLGHKSEGEKTQSVTYIIILLAL